MELRGMDFHIDLSIPLVSTGGSSEGTTRCHAAADVLRALIGAGSEVDTMECISMWVSEDLQAFKADPTRCDVDECAGVVYCLAENVLGDLEAAPGSVHPILQVDAIRYLYTFRNQHRTVTEPPSLVPEASHAMPHTTALVKGTGKW
ncbi:hypothetical protein JB92DRAFT_2826923 [Gautieria morchelliformis]|nr:hypothetical protein JB92DRAFT_2826923 [Gautieria morchelliformis]